MQKLLDNKYFKHNIDQRFPTYFGPRPPLKEMVETGGVLTNC